MLKQYGAAFGEYVWVLPVVAETCDAHLNDMNGFHVRPEHVVAALDGATGGPLQEGSVGGGTGMICYEFKGGTGTASRTVELADSAYDCETDMVIEALGFEPEDLCGQFGASDLAVRDDGTVWSAAGTRATTLEGVFVAGDISRGASLVVWAVREGQDAAAEIHGWLSARQQVAA